MTTWEYNVIDLRNSSDAAHPESSLNDEGKEGWELVAITPDPTNGEYQRYFFKRPLTDGDKKNEGKTT